ncbi:MAG: hypothetical protein NDJ18_03485 [candidate division Zixibacteria bacterium]|nr:hypothetical protein [candidate division Zixibacteria bacterium]
MVSPRLTASGGFTIEVGCPGCGAEIALERDFRLASCRHCGSVLRVIMPDLPPAFTVRPKKTAHEVRFLLDRYCRDQEIRQSVGASPIQLIYIPYWKIDGVSLKTRRSLYEVDSGAEENSVEEQTEERELTTINLANFSTTVLAISADDSLPSSLGLRAEHLAMQPYLSARQDQTASYLHVTVPLSNAEAQAARAASVIGSLDAEGKQSNSTRLFHPRGSLIYFPYFVIDRIEHEGIRRFHIDAVTGRVVGSAILNEPTGEASPEVVATFGAVEVELHRCGNCGVDLPMSRSSVFQCHNCGRVVFLEEHPRLIREILAPRQTAKDTATAFPFWMIHARSNTYGTEDRFLIPAFEMRNAETTFRLIRRMSTAIDHIAYERAAEPLANAVPASRSIDAALTFIEIHWYRRSAESVVPTGAFKQSPPSSIQLIYIPFREDQYFFVDAVLGAVTFEKAGAAAPVG